MINVGERLLHYSNIRVLPRNSLRDVERVLLYGPNIHIKAYCPSTLPHQRKISDEGMLDRHALQLLGRTLNIGGIIMP